MSNRLWIAVLNEWREKFSEILGIYTKPSYKDRPLRKTVFSISLGRSLYTGLTVLDILCNKEVSLITIRPCLCNHSETNMLVQGRSNITDIFIFMTETLTNIPSSESQ